MYCPKCGTENPDDAQACNSCNQNLAFITQQVQALEAKTCGWAVATLVLAILSPFTCMITMLPAVIVGVVALIKISNSNGRLKGNVLAIVGMALPVVLLPVIALMMGILMPTLVRTRSLAFRMSCATNLSGLGKAMMVYANDYDGQLPTSTQWCDLLIECAAVAPQQFQCKGAGEGRCHYAMNKYIQTLGTEAPADMVLLFETFPGWNQVGGPEILTTDNHMGDGCNVLFVDSHVEFVRAADVETLKWKPDP